MKQHIGLNVADLRPTQMTIGRREVDVTAGASPRPIAASPVSVTNRP